MTSAQRCVSFDGTRWKAHHQKGASRRVLLRIGDWRRCYVHDEFAEMLLVQSDSVHGIVAAIGLCAEFGTDGHLGGKTDHTHPDLVVAQGRDCLVNVAGIG